MSIEYIREKGAFVLKCDLAGCENQVVVKDNIVFDKDQSALAEKLRGWLPLRPTIYGMNFDTGMDRTNHICPKCQKLAMDKIEKENLNGNEDKELEKDSADQDLQ